MYDISVVYLLYDTRFVPLDSFTYLSPSTSSLLATSNLFSVSVSLLQLCNYYYFLHCFLNSTCEWIHTAFTFPVCSVRVIPTNSIKVVTNSRISLLYGWVSFHFVYASVYIHVYITFFIHPPINEHLGYFLILTIVKNAAENIEMCTYFLKLALFFSSGKYKKWNSWIT